MAHGAQRDRLRAIWCRLLEQGSVSPDANFFDLGGTSLLAVELAAAVTEHLGVELDAVEVVMNPSFAELDELVAARL